MSLKIQSILKVFSFWKLIKLSSNSLLTRINNESLITYAIFFLIDNHVFCEKTLRFQT